MTGDWLVPDDLWWDGALRTGTAVRPGGPAAALSAVADLPAGAPRRRLPGTVLPGLRDAHVHLQLIDPATLRAGGIASAWDLGGTPGTVAGLARRPGGRLPVIRYAGPFLTAPGGYPTDRAWAPAGSCREVHSADDAAQAVGEATAAGATLVKVTVHAGGPVLPARTLHALVEAAHAGGTPVVVHAEGPGTVASAYEAGADLLAHTPWTEPLDDGLIRGTAARMRWISTLDIHRGEQRDVAIGNLRRFLGHGGTVLYGTDLGNGPLPVAVNPREIRALQAAGLTPAEVLTAMTDPGAGPGWLPGGLDLDPGRFADVLATARVAGPEVRPRTYA